MSTFHQTSRLPIESPPLEVPIGLISVLTLGLTLLLYGAFFPLENNYGRVLLYERGPTQVVVVGLGIFVILFLAVKIQKINWEFKQLAQEIIPYNVFSISPHNPALGNLQQALAQQKCLLNWRCSRVIGTYQHFQSYRHTASFAAEDSLFYQQIADSTYVLPRILIWSIPLLGFMGSLLGIVEAVRGFSGFLALAGDLEQIKASFGAVIQGLVIAFDTTLLALFLGILGMVSLTLVERWESKLLLAIDIYINDLILPRFQTQTELVKEDVNSSITEEAWLDTTPGSINQNGNLVSDVHQLQQVLTALLEGIYQHHQELQNQSQMMNQRLEQVIIKLAEQMERQHQELLAQSQGNSQQWQRMAIALEEKSQFWALDEKQLESLKKFPQILELMTQELAEKEQLTELLAAVQLTLAQLKPGLEQWNKPRRRVWIEQEERD